MASVKKVKTWQMEVVVNGISYYGLLTYEYSSGTYTVEQTDSSYVPVPTSSISDGLVELMAEAKVTIATEIESANLTTETDLQDRLGYVGETVEIQFINAVPATVWTISESVEPHHYQAIKALIEQYLNQLSNT